MFIKIQAWCFLEHTEYKNALSADNHFRSNNKLFILRIDYSPEHFLWGMHLLHKIKKKALKICSFKILIVHHWVEKNMDCFFKDTHRETNHCSCWTILLKTSFAFAFCFNWNIVISLGISPKSFLFRVTVVSSNDKSQKEDSICS